MAISLQNNPELRALRQKSPELNQAVSVIEEAMTDGVISATEVAKLTPALTALIGKNTEDFTRLMSAVSLEFRLTGDPSGLTSNGVLQGRAREGFVALAKIASTLSFEAPQSALDRLIKAHTEVREAPMNAQARKDLAAQFPAALQEVKTLSLESARLGLTRVFDSLQPSAMALAPTVSRQLTFDEAETTVFANRFLADLTADTVHQMAGLWGGLRNELSNPEASWFSFNFGPGGAEGFQKPILEKFRELGFAAVNPLVA